MTVADDAWVWIDERVIRAVHEEQLSEHGGVIGLRDESLLRSAPARPRQLAAYGKPDTAALAAAYGHGLARSHPFVDGNKRTAFVAMELFLRLNGHALSAPDVDCVLTLLAVATGALSEAAFTEWIRRHAAAL